MFGEDHLRKRRIAEDRSSRMKRLKLVWFRVAKEEDTEGNTQLDVESSQPLTPTELEYSSISSRSSSPTKGTFIADADVSG